MTQLEIQILNAIPIIFKIYIGSGVAVIVSILMSLAPYEMRSVHEYSRTIGTLGLIFTVLGMATFTVLFLFGSPEFVRHLSASLI